MVKKLLKNNSGYSLVELLIVIAIVVVLAAAALVSITMVHSARAKDAAIKVGSEVNQLKTKCMNMKPDDGTHDYYALSLYNDSSDVTHICLVKHDPSTDTFDYDTDEDVNLSSSVKVDFSGSYRAVDDFSTALAGTNKIPGHQGDTGTNSPVFICFDKRGNCYSGSGEYNFYKRNGNVVAHVNIRQNGSIDVR
ncbi:MAG: prepilin-type N-terminal cleavage/methylation domain-containing protein [Eubacterium sp.]|nr:prepilin-type N-terminal cleavage/methylation domain-containing protein [Eubacterium sp.]